MNSEEIPSITRLRFLLASVLSWGARAAADTFVSEQQQMASESTNRIVWQIIKVFGVGELKYSPDQIVSDFSNMRFGEVSARYQHFWEIGFTEEEFSKYEKAKEKLEVFPSEQVRFRQRSFLQLMKLHSIAELRLGKNTFIEEDAFKKYLGELSNADLPHLKHGYGRIAAMEMVWMTCTSILTKDEYSWQHANLEWILPSALSFVKFFQQEDFPELIVPAICAMQFLLTYRTSLHARKSEVELFSLNRELLEIERSAREQENYWLSTMINAFKNRTNFSSMPPQFNEVVMGHSAFGDELRNLVISSRFESVYQRARKSTENSPFVSDIDRPSHNTQNIFWSFGVDRNAILPLLSFSAHENPVRGPGHGFKQVANLYLEDHENGSVIETLEAEEHAAAPLIQSMLPFRRFGSRRTVHAAKSEHGFHSSISEQEIVALGHKLLNVDTLIDVWRRGAIRRLNDFEVFSKKNIDRNVINPRIDVLLDQLLNHNTLLALRQEIEMFQHLLNKTHAVPFQSYVTSSVAKVKGDHEVVTKKSAKTKIPLVSRKKLAAIQSAGKEWALKLKLDAQPDLIGQFVGLNSQTGGYVLGSNPSHVLALYKEKFGRPHPPIYLYIVGSELRA